MRPALAIAFAALSILWFPWLVTVAAFVAAETFLFGSALALGIFADLVGRASGYFAAPLPMGTLTGVGVTLALYGLRRFTRRQLIGSGIPAIFPHLFDR